MQVRFFFDYPNITGLMLNVAQSKPFINFALLNQYSTERKGKEECILLHSGKEEMAVSMAIDVEKHPYY